MLCGKGVLALSALLLAIPACSADPPSPKATPTRMTANAFLGDRAIAILDDAKIVEVYRINPIQTSERKGELIQNYPILSRGKDQDERFANALRKILLDAATYSFELSKGCMFEPGVAFRIRTPGGTLEVILCFQCNELNFVVEDARGGRIRDKIEDFDNARPALLKLAKTAFPDDPVIQSLKD